MPFQKLFDYLRSRHADNADLNVYLRPRLSYVYLKKGEQININVTSGTAYFIVSGLIKSYYHDEKGTQIVSRFWKENEIILLKKKRPDPTFELDLETLLALEDCVIIAAQQLDFTWMLENLPGCGSLFRKIYMSDLRGWALRASLLVMPATKAYEQFCRHFPCQRIMLRDIAYYLNIRPYTLSRIRKKR